MGGHGMLGAGCSGCWLWLQVVFGIYCHSFLGSSWSSLCVGTGHRLWLLFVGGCLWPLMFMAGCCLSLLVVGGHCHTPCGQLLSCITTLPNKHCLLPITTNYKTIEQPGSCSSSAVCLFVAYTKAKWTRLIWTFDKTYIVTSISLTGSGICLQWAAHAIIQGKGKVRVCRHIWLGKVEPRRCSLRKVLINKTNKWLGWNGNWAAIVSQFAVTNK